MAIREVLIIGKTKKHAEVLARKLYNLGNRFEKVICIGRGAFVDGSRPDTVFIHEECFGETATDYIYNLRCLFTNAEMIIINDEVLSIAKEVKEAREKESIPEYDERVKKLLERLVGEE